MPETTFSKEKKVSSENDREIISSVETEAASYADIQEKLATANNIADQFQAGLEVIFSEEDSDEMLKIDLVELGAEVSTILTEFQAELTDGLLSDVLQAYTAGTIPKAECSRIVAEKTRAERDEIPFDDIALFLPDNELMDRMQEEFPHMSELPQTLQSNMMAVLLAYGPTVFRSCWTEEGSRDLSRKKGVISNYSDGTEGINTEGINDFFRETSDNVLLKLRVVNMSKDGDDDRLVSMRKEVMCVFNGVKKLPAYRREEVLAVLSDIDVEDDRRHSSEPQPLSHEEVDAMLEVASYLPTPIRSFVSYERNIQPFLSPDRWPGVRRGLLRMGEQLSKYISVTDRNYSTFLSICEHVGTVDTEIDTVFIERCIKQGDEVVVLQDSTKIKGRKSKERSINSIYNVYHNLNEYRKYFSEDRDLTYRYLRINRVGLTDHQQSTIEGIFNGDIFSEEKYMDLSAIEGLLSYQEIEEKQEEIIDTFIKLTRDQKEMCISLFELANNRNVYLREEMLFDLVQSDSSTAQRYITFLQESTLKEIPTIELLDELSKHPECISLFDMLCPRPFKEYYQNEMYNRQIIPLCISLHDAGVSLKQEENYYLDGLLSLDVELVCTTLSALYEQTNEAVDINLISSLFEEFQDPELVLKLYFISLYGKNRDVRRYIRFPEDRQSLEEVEKQYQHAQEVKSVVQRFELVLGRTIENRNMCWDMPEEVVDFLCSEPQVLQTMFDNEGYIGTEISSAIITIPAVYLINPFFWKMRLHTSKEPFSEKYLSDVLAVMQQLDEYDVFQYNSLDEEIPTLFHDAPWLFEESIIRHFKKEMTLVLDVCKDMTQDEFQDIYNDTLSSFDFFDTSKEQFIELLNKRNEIFRIRKFMDDIPKGLFSFFEKKLGAPIPAKVSIKIMQSKRHLAEFMEMVKNSKDIDDFDSLNWDDKQIIKSLQQHLGKKQLRDAGIYEEEFIKVCSSAVMDYECLEQVTNMDPSARAWCTTICEKYGNNFYGNKERFLATLSLSERPDREAVQRLLNKMEERPNSKNLIDTLPSLLTEEMVEKYNQLPKGIILSYKDIGIFFSHPNAEQVIALLTYLWDRFGEQGKYSFQALDVLSIRYQDIQQYLESIDQQSFYPLNLEQLRTMFPLYDGEFAPSIQKIIAMCDGVREAVVPYGELIISLQGESKDITRAVLMNNICTWEELVQYENTLIDSCGWNEHDVINMAQKIYLNKKEPLPDLPVHILIGVAMGRINKIDFLFQIIKSEYIDISTKDSVFLDSKIQGILVDSLEEMTYRDDRVIAQLPFASFVFLFKQLLKYDIPKDILISVAKNRSLSEVIECKDSFPEGGLLEVAKHHPLRETFALPEGTFNKGEIESIILSKSDAQIAREIYDLNQLLEYDIPEEKLRGVAEHRPLREIFALEEGTFTPTEILQIALNRQPNEIIEHQREILDIYAECKDATVLQECSKLIVLALSGTQPDLQHVFTDPNKMGGKIGVFAERLAVYARNEFAKEDQEKDEAQKNIIERLREIKRIYTSTDSAETDRRLIFAEGLSAKNPETGEHERVDESVKERIREHVHNILVQSGSVRELHSMHQRLAKNISEEERASIEQSILLATQTQDAADVRNRSIYQHSNREDAGRFRMLLPEGAYTHGAPVSALDNILDDGAFCGELLGSAQSKTDASGLFGTDTCRVPEGKSDEFADRLNLGNEGYGDVMLIIGAYDQENRSAYKAGVVGEHHYNIPYGIPATEITAIVVKQETHIATTKMRIAEKGIFIPVVDMQGEHQLTPEEFEEMRSFFKDLKGLGYPVEIIQTVYEYYKQQDLSPKNRAVMDKAVVAIREGSTVDLPVLVETLKNDTLNWYDDDWYKTQPFETIYAFFTKDQTRRSQRETRKRLFGDTQAEAVYRRDGDTRTNPERTYHAHLDTFFDRQLNVTSHSRKEIESALTDVLMRTMKFDRIADAARRITEVKTDILKTILTDAWSNTKEAVLSDGMTEEEWNTIASSIIPVISGSMGRGEAVLGSDLDFLFLVDDESQTVDTDKIRNIIDTHITPRVSELLKQYGIRPDAGLANADRNPVTKLSNIRSLRINFGSNRQAEEPTEILDMLPISEEHTEVVQRAKQVLITESEGSADLVSFIERDLEVGSGKKSFVAEFEELYTSFASGQDLNHVKEAMQRTAAFKIYDLVLRSFSEYNIPPAEAATVPAGSFEKVQWLEDHDILSSKEAQICRDTLASAYKLRMMSGFYSKESTIQADDNIPKKVKNGTISQRAISFTDRQFIFNSIKEFRDTVLYK